MRPIAGRDLQHHINSVAMGHHSYLLPKVLDALAAVTPKRVFDIGCNSGGMDQALAEHGFAVTGIDPWEDGVTIARETCPSGRFEVGSCYDDLASKFGTFPAVISLEVVEHVFDPRHFIRTARALLQPSGTLVLSTPYHGYTKNVVLALTNRFDKHLNPLWDGGHIKFWSKATLGALLREVGFTDMSFYRVGRIPQLAKSLIVVAR